MNENYHSIQYNWVCDESGKPPLAQALFFCGSIFGGILLGFLADRLGRIPALIMCNLIGAVAGIITTYSYSFALFAFSRFLMGMAFDNCFTLMYILGRLGHVTPLIGRWRSTGKRRFCYK